jgi:integrase
MRAPLTGSQRKDGYWVVRVTVTRDDGTKYEKPFVRKKRTDAVQAAKDYLLEHGRKASDPHTMPELLEECQEHRWAHLDEDTIIQYDRYGGYAVERFKDLEDIRDLKTPMIASYVRDMEKTSGRHAQLARNVLRIMLKHATEIGWRDHTPVWDVRLQVSPAPKPKRRLTYIEARSIIEAETIPERRLFWWTLMETGMRPQEVTLLTRESILYSQDSYWVTGGIKTAAGKGRTVMIGDSLGGALFDAAPDEGRIFPNIRFVTGDDRRTVGRFLALACRAAGVPYVEPKQFRKLRVSLWRSAGVPDETVKAMIGHTDIRTTVEHYDEMTRERIKRALSGEA